MSGVVDPSVTEEFGPYLVQERLGIGGMATVYRAKKVGIDGYERPVALKRMLSHLTEDRGFVDSFIREAKVASMLVHPNVAQVYDFGRINGVYYIAMELVAGFDMRKLLRHANRTGEPIPLQVLLTILVELCEALEYAHTFVDEQGAALGIVHRDISPSNLIIAHTGHLKVIDFGIAKASSRALHTESGQVKGKLGYMSPEAALGLPIGPASDVFSAGVVAWELITASPLFSAKSDFETMRRIREAEIIPPSRYNPACPPQLDAVVLGALARDVERRMPSAAMFRSRLDEIAMRAQVQVSARAVAEWMMHVPTDGGRSRRPSAWGVPGNPSNPPQHGLQALPPTDEMTANIRPSGGNRGLQRSEEEAALATEIWGDEDARGPGSPGPNFSATTPPPVQAYEPPRPVAMPIQYQQAPPMAPQPIPTKPMRAQPPPPGLDENIRPRRRPIVIVLAVAIVATIGAMIGVVWPRESGAPVVAAAAGSDAAVGANPGSAVATAQPPIDAATPSVPVGAAIPPTPPTPPTPGGKTVHPPVTPPPTTPPHGKHPGTHVVATHDDPVETPAHVEPPVTPPVVDTPVTPPPVAPPPVTPPPVTPPPVTPKVPARTPVVAATAVTKLAGELPQLQVHGNDTNGDVLAKMCIDDAGRVSSVKVIKSPAEITAALQHALEGWRYKPYLQDGNPLAVCFALSLRVVVQHAD